MDTQENLLALLTAVKNGELDVAAGMERLRDLPYLEMGHTKIDLHRPLRNGFPEVVYAAGRTPGQVVEIFTRLRGRGPVLATRVPGETASQVLAACPEVRHNALGRTLTMEEAFRGGGKPKNLQEQTLGPDGRPRLSTKTLDVTIPAGVKDGARIRLAGQGSPGGMGGPAGDLYLKVRIAPHPLFKLEGEQVVLDLPLAPWEAALGCTVKVPTLDRSVELTVPPGVSSGQKLRLRGLGLGSGAGKGDQLVRIMIKTPPRPTAEERELWEKLAAASGFAPREF